MLEPRVSVVISTHDRPHRLRRLLRSLEQQTLPPEEFEVVVVDDGSQSATSDLLASEQKRGKLRLRALRPETSRGPASGRNQGWRAAKAELIAFTDDDCTADADWLTEGLAAAAAHPFAVLQGSTEPDPAELGKAGLLGHTLQVNQLGPQYQTCNMFYRARVLGSLGGFDEYFDRPGGEDTDLAWRAIESGYGTVFAPRAVIYHAVEQLGMRGSLRRAGRWSPTVRVFARHPQTRSMLYRGRFWNVWHYLLWRSLLALPAPRWLRRMVLTRHLSALHQRARKAGAGSWAVPFLIVHDCVECWAIARGALRHRTLVL